MVPACTRMWEESPDLMTAALHQHDRAIDDAIGANNGDWVKPRGEDDSRFVVFASASDADVAAADKQRSLAATEWVTPTSIPARPR